MKVMALYLSMMLLSACQSKDVDWIEVPLEEATFFQSKQAYQVGEYDILVLANTDLEYKLGLDAGDSITYSWDVKMADSSLLSTEFHGHTHREGDEPGTVMFYKIHNDGQEQGALVAPFDGIHGWYMDNRSSEDITVRLRVAGFYEILD